MLDSDVGTGKEPTLEKAVAVAGARQDFDLGWDLPCSAAESRWARSRHTSSE